MQIAIEMKFTKFWHTYLQ